MVTPAQLGRLAAAVRERRLELGGMTQSEAASMAGVSDTTWNQVEAGKAVSARSMAKVERALGWQVGSHALVMRGDAPIPAGAPVDADASSELLGALRELTEAVRDLRRDLRTGRR